MNRGIIASVLVILAFFVFLLLRYSILKPSLYSSEKLSTSSATITPLPLPLATYNPQPTTNPNLPLLYQGVEWGEQIVDVIRFRNEDNTFVEKPGYSIDSKNLSYPTDVIKYYKNELSKKDWKETWSAGGPTGESYGYQKKDMYFQFGVQKVPEKEYLFFVEYSQ